MKSDTHISPGNDNSANARKTPLRRPVTPENLISLIDWNQLIYGILRRSWIIVLLTVAGLSAGIYASSKLGQPRYEARASLLYRPDRQAQIQSSTGFGITINGLSYATAVSLLRRAANLEKVISNLNLNVSREEFGWRVQTESERNSEIILLRVEFMPTPEMAIKAANEVARVGLEDNQNFYRKQALQLTDQFLKQIDTAEAEAEAARNALIDYQTRNQLLEVNADTKAFLDNMGSVNERLHAARIARDSQSVRIANYKRLIEEMPEEILRESFEDNPLKRRIANTEVALMEARTRYGPDNPRILQMEDSIKEMRRTMSSQSFDKTRERVYTSNPAKEEFKIELMRLEADQEVLDKSVSQVEQQAAELNEKYNSLPAKQLKLAALHQQQTAAESLVLDLKKSINDARRIADLDLSDFELLEPSRTATETRGKLGSLVPALAVVFSLFSGLGLCLILSLIDPKLRSAGQVKRLYSLPCLGSIATSKHEEDLPSVFLPICRILYQFAGSLPSSKGTGFLCILSACPGDGRSTLAFQAAHYWTTLGIKTAYLDFSSAGNRYLYPDKEQAGIEDYLTGRASLDEIMFSREDITCFKRMRHSDDLPEQMHGTPMKKLMEFLRNEFAYVIIESPPWLTEETSARMLAGESTLSVWVAATPNTTRTTLNKVFDSLDQAGVRPDSLILNKTAGSGRSGRKKIATS